MMEFIVVYGVIMMMVVLILGSMGVVEMDNTVVTSNETGFTLVNDNDVNLAGVDFNKLRQ